MDILITGGAGFLGVNAAAHFARLGWPVTLFDSLVRPGTELNLAWLSEQLGPRISFVQADIRDRRDVAAAVKGKDVILHLAAQVAVTTSMIDPETDFEVNARGTLNVLEGVRAAVPAAIVLYASTNKVYGALDSNRAPVPEGQPIDFHTPYGCSKGAADQYVRDYARSYGLRTVVFRQSCIYGAHQLGSEDQGWVAHFVRSIVDREPITIYGDGHQVRDLLDVRDLCRLYERAISRIESCAGRALNAGGGPGNAYSLLEVISAIERLTGIPAAYVFRPQRPGDQRYYVSDIRLAQQVVGWHPEIPFQEGLAELVTWCRSNRKALVAAS